MGMKQEKGEAGRKKNAGEMGMRQEKGERE
jgi:hypothetical protein